MQDKQKVKFGRICKLRHISKWSDNRTENPNERGLRFVITHAGGKDGFVEGAKIVVLAKKGVDNYFDEMDGSRFEKWFTEQL